MDFHFRTRAYIEALRDRENFTVFEVRGDLQALDVRDLEKKLAASDVFFDGNPFIGSGLLDFVAKHGTPYLSIFLAPLSREEVLGFKARERSVSLPELLTDMMRRKLLRRTTRQKGILSLRDLENIETRAASAYDELKQAWRFDYVIPNHDGEDSENWDAFYHPVGDARQALLAFGGSTRSGPGNSERSTRTITCSRIPTSWPVSRGSAPVHSPAAGLAEKRARSRLSRMPFRDRGA